MSKSPDDYGPEHKSHLLEQYKLYVEMTNRVSQRRDHSNKFYVTIVSALVAIVIIIARFGVPESGALLEVAFVVISLLGSALSVIWIFNIRSYRTFNSAKFEIINRIEKQLPFSAYTEEWGILRPPEGKARYIPLSRVEQFVPAIFLILFIVLAIYSIRLLSA